MDDSYTCTVQWMHQIHVYMYTYVDASYTCIHVYDEFHMNGCEEMQPNRCIMSFHMSEKSFHMSFEQMHDEQKHHDISHEFHMNECAAE